MQKLYRISRKIHVFYEKINIFITNSMEFNLTIAHPLLYYPVDITLTRQIGVNFYGK